MAEPSYPFPVSKLLTLGDCHQMRGWPDYLRLGLAPEHIPDLIRMALDDELHWYDSDSAEAWAQLGTCHYHRKEYDEAIAVYAKAIALDNGSATAHRGIGVVYMTQFLLSRGTDGALREKALAAWHHSLGIDPDQEDIARLVRKYSPKPGLPGPEL